MKEDLCCSPADLVHGQMLHLLGEFQAPLSKVTDTNDQYDEFLRTLRHTVSKLRAAPPRLPEQQPLYIPPALRNSEYIWVRHDSHYSHLQRPYNRPYKVIVRLGKHYTIQLGNKTDAVSVDRLKPANLPMHHSHSPTHTPMLFIPSSHSRLHTLEQQLPLGATDQPPWSPGEIYLPNLTSIERETWLIITRSGRVSRLPERYMSTVTPSVL